jgi:phage gp46-like protein
MIYNRYQGDPAVKITPDGAKMKFVGGQPIMDQGFENAAQISLYTKKGWWGNALLVNDNQKIGSDFTKIRTVVDVQTINDYRRNAELALKWMLDTGLADSITVTVTNPYTNQIWNTIIITPPGKDAQTLLFIKNGLNWIYQAEFPVSEKMKDIR